MCDSMFDFDHRTHFSLPPNLQCMGQDKPVTAKASGGVDLRVCTAKWIDTKRAPVCAYLGRGLCQ